MKPVALCSRKELLDRWLQAFPAASVLETLPDRPMPAGTEQLWLHAEGRTPPELGEAVRALMVAHPHGAVVVMAHETSQQGALHAMNNGARGYCHALATPEMLRQVLLVVANGGVWIGADLMQRLLGSVSGALAGEGGSASPELDRLSPRERAVALEVGKGATNKEIARTLGISERTVKAHLGSAFEKLGVRDRLELVIVMRRPAGTLVGDPV